MRMLWPIILFSSSLAGALVLFVMAVSGLRRKKIGYEPGRPPLEFATQPLQFSLLIIVYLALGVLLTVGAAKSGVAVWRML